MARQSSAKSSGRRKTPSAAKATKPVKTAKSKTNPAADRKPGKRVSSIWDRLRRIAAVSIAVAVLTATAGILWFARDLPNPREIARVTRTPAISLLDSRGREFANFGGVVGDQVSVDQLPPWLIAAVIATEDRRFYRHFGIDLRGIFRAAFRNLREGGVREGGSTITQQLAKNLFLTHQRSYKRKIQEVLLALWLEQNLSKDEILTLYLNRVYFGAGAYGVDAAARRYFAKPATGVTLGEAAMLAGLLTAPSRYAPTVNPQGARARAGVVLSDMVEAGLLEDDQADAAKARTVSIATQPTRRRGRYFADWVRDQLPDYVGTSGNTDLVVGTTLDVDLQAAAESAISETMAAAKRDLNAGQAALIAMTGNGAVRAMVGGADYRASSYNRAVTALRQPGSAFKLFVYLAALENGISPSSRVVDAPLEINGWKLRNYSGRFRGDMSLREAFATSVNTVAVWVSERLGRGRVIDTARRLGITSKMASHPSIALGAAEVTLIELTAAYAAVANGGFGVWPHAIVEVGGNGDHGLYRRQGTGPGRVLSATTSRQMTALLQAVVTSGTGRAAQMDGFAAGKTGTSQDYRDAWFVGFSGDLVVGVWVGNDNATPMRGVTGGTLPARIWRQFMSAVLPASRPAPVPKPAADAPTLWQRLSDMLYQENR